LMKEKKEKAQKNGNGEYECSPHKN
jgi:hypothetical protein